ncbi:MAG: polyphosphate kinase 1 [Gammaproteobacteria bacterium]|nr:MAG: polyphosphate kinase 1 [Gammaproteobacteria bacterium]
MGKEASIVVLEPETTVKDTVNLKLPEFYVSRDLSMLQFNRRVLELALDEGTPLLERLRFLCISSTNLDEFFEIRVAGHMQKAEAGAKQAGPDSIKPKDLLKSISVVAHELVDEQYRVLNTVLFPALAKENIRFIRRRELSQKQEAWIRSYFDEALLPVLSPLGLDPAHPFPRILNKSLNFIISLKGKDAFGRGGVMAIVQAPRSLPRITQLPPEETDGGPYDFVFLSSIIHAYVDELFPGMKVTGCYQFRVTRNSDLYVDEEEVDDLLRALEGELPSRRYGDEVRVEVADDAPEDIVNFLLHKFGLTEDDSYLVNGPVNLNRLIAVCDIVDRPDLKYPPFTPSLPIKMNPGCDLFEAIRDNDYLLHHPFESFVPVIEFLRQAANDKNVLAIKQTLYRTGPESAVVDALVTAAQNAKEVTVIIELRARFDEAENIALATRLQESGAHVVYGVVGYKTHAKMILVVRREGRTLRRYVHLGTGNYHPRTTRLYTDYGLFTSDKAMGKDAHQVFMQMTSLGKGKELNKMLQSPFSLYDGLIERIERETENAKQGKPARIIAKMNGLTEKYVIQTLYKASMAGVQIDLIIRGVCCLKPEIPGVSDNIRVRSIMGQFLEHTRVFYFENNGNQEVFLSSADWMDRNLHRRVETAFPVESKKLRRRLVNELGYYLKDNTQMWRMLEDGNYEQALPGNEAPFSAQDALLREFSDA